MEAVVVIPASKRDAVVAISASTLDAVYYAVLVAWELSEVALVSADRDANLRLVAAESILEVAALGVSTDVELVDSGALSVSLASFGEAKAWAIA